MAKARTPPGAQPFPRSSKLRPQRCHCDWQRTPLWRPDAPVQTDRLKAHVSLVGEAFAQHATCLASTHGVHCIELKMLRP